MSETVVTVESGNRNNAQAPPPPKPAAPQQSSAGPLSWITFNTAYFQSVPGLLKLIQLVSEEKYKKINSFFYQLFKYINRFRAELW